MESWGLFVGIVTVVLSLAGGLLVIFKYIQAQRDASYLYTDKAIADEAKRRHDLGNTAQLAIGKIETNLRALEREAVRRDDLIQLENRLVGAMNKLETKLESETDKIDKKLDRLLSPARSVRASDA